jgi:hypothetical protein
MDIVNTLELIIPKMRQQMFQKRIYSLDVLYEAIEEVGKYYSIKEIDIFFAKLGIFLKSQEITELLHHCRHSETQIDLIKLVYLFRTTIPEDIVDELNEIFNILSNGQASINLDELMKHLNEKEHPQCELMKKDLQFIKDSVIKGIKNIIGDKTEILREEFLEFHYNIFWVMPEYCHGNFRKKIASMWNVQF